MSRTSFDVTLPDAGATEALGSALAGAFPGAAEGAVVHLNGELGAGKTTCVRSLLHTLGVTGTVRSPTYTLVEPYTVAALNCVHVDLYRLQSVAQVEELGLRDMTGPGYLLFIEWPEKGGDAVPKPDLIIELRYAGDARSVRLKAVSGFGGRWIETLGTHVTLGHDSRIMSYVPN